METWNIAGAAVQFFISLFVPIALVWHGRKKGWLSWKPLLVGIVVFILFSQVLEKALHFAVIDESGTALKWTDSTAWFVAYAALAAGVFEELGRYAGFRWLLKKHRSYGDGVSFGIGHGGIEAILIGALGAINAIVLMSLIQSGAFDETIAPALSPEQAALLKERINGTTFPLYVLGGLERVFAIAFHVAMSLLVLLGVRTGAFRYVMYAILLHALLDVAAALYQVGAIASIWVVEALFGAAALAAFAWTRRVKTKFESGEER